MSVYKKDGNPNIYNKIRSSYQSDYILTIQLKLGEDMVHKGGIVTTEVPFIFETTVKFFPELILPKIILRHYII